MRIDIARHGAREHLLDGVTAPMLQRPLDPGADEAHLVVEADTALALELPDLIFDLFADIVAARSNSRMCRPILRSMTVFFSSRSRNCRSILSSNVRKAVSGMAITRDETPPFRTFTA